MTRYTISASLLEFAFRLRQCVNAVFDYRWNHDPFGKTTLGSRDDYLRLQAQTKKSECDSIDKLEETTGFAISSDWLDELALHTQIVIKNSPPFYHHGRLLYSILRDYISRAEETHVTVLETGSARGFSALCMARAIVDSKVGGVVLSIDLLPHHRPQYWNCIDDHERKKSRSELLSPWAGVLQHCIFLQGDTYLILPRLGLERINFAFLDAQHIEENVLHEFSCISRRQKKGDVVVFDDVSEESYPGVVRAVRHIERAAAYEVTWMPLDGQRGFAWATRC